MGQVHPHCHTPGVFHPILGVDAKFGQCRTLGKRVAGLEKCDICLTFGNGNKFLPSADIILFPHYAIFANKIWRF